jgi:hypothetical protein
VQEVCGPAECGLAALQSSSSQYRTLNHFVLQFSVQGIIKTGVQQKLKQRNEFLLPGEASWTESVRLACGGLGSGHTIRNFSGNFEALPVTELPAVGIGHVLQNLMLSC